MTHFYSNKKNNSLFLAKEKLDFPAWEKSNWSDFFTNLLFLFLSFFVFNQVNGQVANYTFTQASGTHTPVTTSNASGNNWDDEINNIAIPFTFNFNSIDYTACNVSSNGFITFGATAPGTTNYTPISSGAGYAGAISALGIDLGHNGTRIKYGTAGTTPNRIFTIQWIDARRFIGGGKRSNDFDFQINLFETTNVIQVVYGPCASAYATDAGTQVGLRGSSNTDFNNRTTVNNWPGSTAGAVNTATCNTGDGLGELPTNGLTYTWTPRPIITSLGSVSGCVGTSITINGANFTGATAANVQIGGTPVTSITSNSGTVIVAVIGSGTTGLVTVTTVNGTATSAATFTVNPVPAAILGGALSVCVGATTVAFTDATVGGTWSTSNGNATISPAGIVTGVTAGAVNVVYTVGTCSVTTPITVSITPVAIAGGALTVCTGVTTAAFTNTVGGGTWSTSNANATINASGIVLGVTPGAVNVIYTIGTCVVSTPITVNAAPLPIGGGALAVCVGSTTVAFTDATVGGTWSTSNGNATISPAGIATGVSAGVVNIIYTLGTCSSTTALTVNPLPSTVATPTPTTGATGVCYAGAGAVTSISWSAAPGATSYDVYFGAGSLPGALTANVATNTYNTGALLANTTYFWRIVSKNACGNGVTSATFTFTTALIPCVSLVYCIPTHTVSCSGTITNVSFNTINNTSGCLDTNGTSFTNYALGGIPTTSLFIGATYNLSVSASASSIVSAWIDYNANSVFEASEWTQVYTTGTLGNVNIVIPLTATAGTSTIRIRTRLAGNTNGSGDACTSFGSGETEDYRITLLPLPACVTPISQPTVLNLTASGTIISGSFTAASPIPNSYLVVISTNPVAPTPVNGTTYAIGGAVGAGYTVVDTDTNTAFSATGLTNSTTYYLYVFSYNNLCLGGPLYLIPSPLIGNTTTTAIDYCIPTSTLSTRYVEDISTAGYLTNLLNMGTGRSATGYVDYTATSPVTQIPNGGVTIDYRLVNSRQYVKVWVDWNNDNVFTDSAPELVYTTSGVQTIAGSAGFVIPGATAPGNYRIRFRSYESSQTFGPCGNLSTGETEDYRLTVVADCTAKTVIITDGSRCDSGIVILNVTGTIGTTEFRFYNARTGGSLVGTSLTGTWNTPVIPITTKYYVTAYNGSCESLYREEIVATINPTTTIIVTPSVPEVCGENNVVSVMAAGDIVIDYLVDEDFEGGGFGVLTRVNVAADANTQWTNRVSPYVPTGSVWKPAITSRTIGDNFALSVSDFAAPAPKDTQLRTIDLNTTAYSDLFLSFRHYFSYYVGEPLQFADIDVSTNGGGAWTNVQSYTSTQGFAAAFDNVTINLSAYAGLPQVMIRFRYQLQGSAFCDGWAVDDVQVYGSRPLNTTFTWTGGTVAAFIDLACTTPYVAQAVTTIYVKPTGAQITAASWSFDANATLGNGCPVTKNIVITNKTKTWTGSTSNDWNNPGNWLPAVVPDITTCVIIPSTVTPSILNVGSAGSGKTLIVKNSGTLEVTGSNSLTIKEAVDVNAGGIFRIKNNASLVQIDNVTNLGNINMERIASLKLLDYCYWSSPVGNSLLGTFPIGSVSPLTSAGLIYKWDTTAVNANGGQGNWLNTAENMIPTKGYIVRGPAGFNNITSSALTANFIGVPNNGTFTPSIFRGTDFTTNGTQGLPRTATDDNWNLLGNPYPSSLGVNEFLTANTANIQGFVKVWTHGNLPSTATIDPFYQDFGVNYTVTDYVTVNLTGAISGPGDFKIAAGQGFMVLMNSGAAGSSTVTFNNTMRSATFANNQFYKNGNLNNRTDVTSQNRIWLDLVSSTGAATRTLIGYTENATQGNDHLYDAFTDYKAPTNFYSLINNEPMNIQGRTLPFDVNDTVPMGLKIPTNGTYSIAIAAVDGLFAGNTQTIYLEDKLLNIVHNLSTSRYQFTANQGITNDRFVLKYTDNTLSINNFDYSNDVKIYANNDINIRSMNQSIKQVIIYDILGKILVDKNNIGKLEVTINELKSTTNVLIIKVILDNNGVIIKKVIF